MPDPTADRTQIGQLPSSGTPRVAMNLYLRMIQGVLPYYYSHVFRAANQTIASGSGVWNSVSWDTQQDDVHNLWQSGTPTNLIIPEAGIYQIDFQVAWDNPNTTGERGMRLTVAGTSIAEQESAPTATRVFRRLSTVARLAANAVLLAQVTQNSGAGVDVVGGGANSYVSSLKVVELWRP